MRLFRSLPSAKCTHEGRASGTLTRMATKIVITNKFIWRVMQNAVTQITIASLWVCYASILDTSHQAEVVARLAAVYNISQFWFHFRQT
jgi:hypothetical protein